MIECEEMEYFARRAEQETVRAREAVNPAVSHAHSVMAEAYLRILETAEMPVLARIRG